VLGSFQGEAGVLANLLDMVLHGEMSGCLGQHGGGHQVGRQLVLLPNVGLDLGKGRGIFGHTPTPTGLTILDLDGKTIDGLTRRTDGEAILFQSNFHDGLLPLCAEKHNMVGDRLFHNSKSML
jgi:hypothetical protein